MHTTFHDATARRRPVPVLLTTLACALALAACGGGGGGSSGTSSTAGSTTGTTGSTAGSSSTGSTGTSTSTGGTTTAGSGGSTASATDFSAVPGLQLRPGTATVKVGQSLGLKVANCFATTPGPSGETRYACDTDLLPLNLSIGNCAVNGIAGGDATVGRVTYNTGDLTYVAPGTCPTPATVAVSCDATPISGAGAKQVLVANVTVIGDGYGGTIGGTSIFPGVTGTITPTAFSGFTVDASATIAGDVTKYVGGKGVAALTYTQDGCSPAQVSIPVEASILVWDKASPSANGAMAGAYSIVVSASQGVPVTTNCGGATVQLVAFLYPMSTDCPGTLANSQKYTDPARLAGSANWTCSSGGLDLGAQMTWSLTQ